jgi:hypothetical protein
LATFLFQSSTALAHGSGHDAPINDEKALAISTRAVALLVESNVGLGFGKLKPTWTALPLAATRIHAKGNGYYIVSVEHKKEGRTLFILISAFGDIYDANFTGKFQGVGPARSP